MRLDKTRKVVRDCKRTRALPRWSPARRLIFNGLVLWMASLLLSGAVMAQTTDPAAELKAKTDAAKGQAAGIKGKIEAAKGKLEAEKAKVEAELKKAEALKKPADAAGGSRVTSSGTILSDPNVNLLERSVHAIELEKYLALRKPGMNTDEVWSKVFRTVVQPAKYRDQQLKGVQEVYGYHPFWVGNAWKSYNFELVNRVGYYAYPVDAATGNSVGDMNQWLTTGLQAEAHAHGAKVDLVVALHGAGKVKMLLDSRTAQDRLIYNAIDLLPGRGDGINLDFQEIPTNRKAEFSAFVIRFYERLKLASQDYELRMTLPILDPEHVFEFAKYADIVTAFVVTGYDCYGARNAKPGPASVLMSSDQWRKPDLLMSVKSYLDAGLKLDQIILSLPHYGKEWRVTTNERGQSVTAIDAVRPYNYFTLPHEGKARFDSLSSTAYRIAEGLFVTRYYWWDDSASLVGKYAYVKEKQLRGIGIWALGYDNGRHELWNLLGTQFAVPKSGGDSVKTIAKAKPIGPYSPITRASAGHYRWIGRDTFPLPAAWLKVGGSGVQDDFLLNYGDIDIDVYKNIGLLIQWVLLVLVAFAEMGFLLALLRSDLRDMVFVHRRGLAYLYFFTATLVPLMILRCFGIYIHLSWMIILLLMSLLLASMISAKMVDQYNRPKP